MLFAFSFFSLGVNTQSTTPSEISYTLMHTGATPYNIENNNSFYKYSTSFNAEYIMTTTDTLQECKEICKTRTICLGLAHYYDENNIEHCNLLTNLGDVSVTNVNVSCYKKVSYLRNTDLHSIAGKVIDTYTELQSNIHKVYIDVNLNGVFDNDEPFNVTNVDGKFLFTNLSVNNYLVRELQGDNCIQLVPGIRGINGIVRGSGFVDNVVEYYFDGHHTNAHFNGGMITNIETGEFTPKTDVLWYSYNNRDNMFVSFFPKYNITYAFVDETIIDGPGSDIVITTFLNSTTNAHVSVSDNNLDFEYVGILNGSLQSPHELDLGNINYTKHVAYISFHFFELEDDYNSLNIITINGKIDSLGTPSFGMFASVPQKKEDRLIFVKDCHYGWGCDPYCIFGKLEKDQIDSCFVGCKMWEKTTSCKCSNYDEYNIEFDGNEFHTEHCIDGCRYAINRDIFPDYTIRLNTGGVKRHNFLNNVCNDTSDQNCFLSDLKICSSLNNCSAISFNDSSYGMFFDSYVFLDDNSSIFLVKNDHLGDNELEDFKYTTSMTSTPTTSMTSTPQTTVYTVEQEQNYNKKSHNLSYIDIILIVVACCMLVSFIIMLLSFRKRNKVDNRPSFTYSNPIYSYDNNNNIVEENDENDNTFYDEAVQQNGTQYYNDVDPKHTIQQAEEQKNRYKLGLDPLPPFVSQNASNI